MDTNQVSSLECVVSGREALQGFGDRTGGGRLQVSECLLCSQLRWMLPVSNCLSFSQQSVSNRLKGECVLPAGAVLSTVSELLAEPTFLRV